jgi:hypothetical protein
MKTADRFQLGLDSVTVERRGNLAPMLAAAFFD